MIRNWLRRIRSFFLTPEVDGLSLLKESSPTEIDGQQAIEFDRALSDDEVAAIRDEWKRMHTGPWLPRGDAS